MAHITHTSPISPSWDTAALGRPAGASALENNALTAHLSDCGARRSALHSLWAGADGLREMVAARVVTTVLVLTLLLGASWLLR